jgi:hypothetical protein
MNLQVEDQILSKVNYPKEALCGFKRGGGTIKVIPVVLGEKLMYSEGST